MKYIVTRTSSWHDKPCEECYQESVIKTDARCFASEEMLLEKEPDWYTRKGFFNHRTAGVLFLRDYYSEEYIIKINSLEELNSFIDKYGEIIISEEDESETNLRRIEIYDDWRE